MIRRLLPDERLHKKKIMKRLTLQCLMNDGECSDEASSNKQPVARIESIFFLTQITQMTTD
jgi:hypothetical protein